MSVEELVKRSESKCELCRATDDLGIYQITQGLNEMPDNNIYICKTCETQLENPEIVDVNHWRCLNDSMWSSVPAVQVISFRMLKQLSSEAWAQDLFDMLYLDEETLSWAEISVESEIDDAIKHIDSNGVLLEPGDSVTLIKDLNVKGASFTAKRGTAVRRISLDPYNPEHIEGRVNGQKIVILTKYVKKLK